MATSAAFAAATSICRRHAKSFYFSSFFLPKPKRDAAYAVYAFCRLLDDATDEATDLADAQWQIDHFCGLLDQIYAGNMPLEAELERVAPSCSCDARVAVERSSTEEATQASQLQNLRNVPMQSALAMIAFAETVKRCDIPKNYFVEIAEGCRMDLTIYRYQTWEDLRKYCYRVAGVVGLIMSKVFGLDDPAAEAQAVLMGEAMQLTNILRDVKEDFARGRIYLPLEDLGRFGYTERDLAEATVNEPFRQLMRFEIDRARQLYRDGAAGLRHLTDDGSRFTAAAMGVIYSGILQAIERQNYDVFAKRARLTLPQKLLRLPTARRVSRTGVWTI
jgi:phytoene synthase